MIPKSGRKPFVHTYTEAKTREYKDKVATYAKTKMRDSNLGMFLGPVVLEVHGYWNTLGAPRKREPRPMYPKATIPDWDNLGKGVSDALKGVCFKDDGQVFAAVVQTWHCGQGDKPRVEIKVTSLTLAECYGLVLAPRYTFEELDGQHELF